MVDLVGGLTGFTGVCMSGVGVFRVGVLDFADRCLFGVGLEARED